jgi:helicase
MLRKDLMRFLGLFVGVDRQLDPAIRAPSFAGRDARSLYAAYADLNDPSSIKEDPDTILLTGDNATRHAVLRELETLVDRSEEETPEGEPYTAAHIHFSCHGTPDGRLLLADARADDIQATALDIEDLCPYLSGLKVGTTIVTFDSCFSGTVAGLLLGMSSPGRERNRALRTLSGQQRAIMAASCDNEFAWESSRHGHGLLTYALLEGLFGTGARPEHGRIRIGAWLDYSSSLVNREASRMGRQQTPFCDFHVNAPVGGEPPAIPHRIPGPRRSRQLAEHQLHVVGPDPHNLAAYGLDEQTIGALCRRLDDAIRGSQEKGRLNELQQRAIAEGALTGEKNFVIAAPTSSGKTLIGELAVLVTNRRGLKSVVLVPYKALAEEQWEEFSRTFGPAGIRAVRSYGGVNDDDALINNNHFDVAFLTYEKFTMLALTRHSLLTALGLVVLDEAHMISDEGRGRVVELLLTFLLDHQRRSGGVPVILALSAALGDLNGFPQWLNEATLIEEPHYCRPVPLEERVVAPTGNYMYVDSSTGEVKRNLIFSPAISFDGLRPGWNYEAEVRTRTAAALVKELMHHEERVVIFRDMRRSVITFAKLLARILGLRPAAQALGRFAHNGNARDSSRASVALSESLQLGVGIHVSDLDQHERREVEGAYRNREFQVLVSTSGLAMGVNMPATVVVIADHQRWRGRMWKPYLVSEYKNMAGRAGRWMHGIRRGVSYLVAISEAEAERLCRRYVQGTPERLVSRLTSFTPEDLTLALLTLSGRVTPQRLEQMVAKTFEGYQQQTNAGWRACRRAELTAAISNLERAQFVERLPEGTFDATEYGRIAGRGAISFASAFGIRTVAERAASEGEPLDEATVVTLIQLADELHDVYTPCGNDEEDYWKVRVKAALGDQRRSVFSALQEHDDVRVRTGRLKRVYAILMWLQQKPILEIEASFSKEYQQGEPAAAAIRSAASRTSDLLPCVTAILTTRFPDRADDLAKMALVLRPRLEIGVARRSAPLLRARLGLRRVDLAHLDSLGITTPEALREALVGKVPDVISHFGSNAAADLLTVLDRRLAPSGRQVQVLEEELQLELIKDLGSMADL